MHSKLVSWSRHLYLAGMVLALVLVVPTAWFPFQLAKLAVFALALLVATILFVRGGGMQDLSRAHGLRGALLVLLLPLTYLISLFFSVDRSVGVTGFGIETDTLVFSLIATVAFIIAFALFRTLRTARLLLSALFGALIFATVFQCISVVFGSSLIPFSAFADRSVNLVGKWNDLGVLAGLLLVLVLSQIEIMTLSPLRRGLSLAFAGLLAVLLAVINFPVVWALILAASIVLAIVAFVLERPTGPRSDASSRMIPLTRMPWFALLGVIVSTLFLFFGSAANIQLTSLFPVSSLEVRPSYSSTLEVMHAAQQGSVGRMLVGTGPNTFGQEWLLHKPKEVNSSPFWNLDFNVGFSTIVTALGTVGLLGVLAWLIPTLLVLAGLVRAVRLRALSREEEITASVLGMVSLFLGAVLIFYTPSQNTVLLSLILSGAAFGFLWRQGQPAVHEEEHISRKSRLLQLAGAVTLLVLALVGSVTTARRFIAQAYVNQGLAALQNNDLAGALAKSESAQKVEQTPDGLQLAVTAGGVRLQQIAADTTLTAEVAQAQFAAQGQITVPLAQKATILKPSDYRPYVALANIYTYLASLGVQGAYEGAQQAYQSAMERNPQNPQIALLRAKLEAAQGNVKDTQTYLSQALTLKTDYTDAILFLVQLNVANKDLPSAIRAATAAVQSAPGVAPIWFELGLLYYSGGDTANALVAFQKAVDLVPNYANAKYFLGLSYYAQGKMEVATTQFEELAKSNPENQEVALIFSNLKAGKPPFPQTATSTPPESRATAPISQ